MSMCIAEFDWALQCNVVDICITQAYLGSIECNKTRVNASYVLYTINIHIFQIEEITGGVSNEKKKQNSIIYQDSYTQ